MKNFDFILNALSNRRNDTLSLKINGREIYRNDIIHGDLSGANDLYIQQDQNGLWIGKAGKRVNSARLESAGNIDLEIKINSEILTRSLNLRDGKYIFIIQSSLKDGLPTKILVNQQKYFIGFE